RESRSFVSNTPIHNAAVNGANAGRPVRKYRQLTDELLFNSHSSVANIPTHPSTSIREGPVRRHDHKKAKGNEIETIGEEKRKSARNGKIPANEIGWRADSIAIDARQPFHVAR